MWKLLMEIVDISKIFRQDLQSWGQSFSPAHLYRHPLATSCILNDSRQGLVLIWSVHYTRCTYFIFLDLNVTVWDIPKEPKRLHCRYCLALLIGLMQKPFGGCMSDLEIQISWATNLQCWKHKVQRSGNLCFCTVCVCVCKCPCFWFCSCHPVCSKAALQQRLCFLYLFPATPCLCGAVWEQAGVEYQCVLCSLGVSEWIWVESY